MKLKLGQELDNLSLFFCCLDGHLLESISAKIQPTLQISIDWRRMQHEKQFAGNIMFCKTFVYPFELSMISNIS